jgi:hypothetical protein
VKKPQLSWDFKTEASKVKKAPQYKRIIFLLSK